MEKLPPEILDGIIEELRSAADVGNLRALCKRLAKAGWKSCFKHIGVVNTRENITSLVEFLGSNHLLFTTHLTLYHGSWPVYSNRVWKGYPLLLGGRGRSVTACCLPMSQAFNEYWKFIS